MTKSNRCIMGFLAIFSATSVFGAQGFITPTSLSMTITNLALIPVGAGTNSNNYNTLISTNTPFTVNRADTDFVASSLGKISIPAGRFSGISITYLSARSFKANGVKYTGMNGTAISNGNTVYSSGTDASLAGALTTTVGTATTLGNYSAGGSNTTSGSTTYFPNIICVGAGGVGCQSGDTILDPTTTSVGAYIMLDLYNVINVNADTGSASMVTPSYPYVVFGAPGAAIHLESVTAGTSASEITLLFDGSTNLMQVIAGSAASTVPAAFCGVSFYNNGVSNVTAVPSGVTISPSGAAIGTFNSTTGVAKWAIGSNFNSAGAVTTGNLLQAVGTTINLTCAADSDSSNITGYTYTGGAGTGGGSQSFTIARIVDPSNLFGVCNSSAAGYIAGSTPSGKTGGVCGSYP